MQNFTVITIGIRIHRPPCAENKHQVHLQTGGVITHVWNSTYWLMTVGIFAHPSRFACALPHAIYIIAFMCVKDILNRWMDGWMDGWMETLYS